MSPEIKFCARYLRDHGISALDYSKIILALSPNDPTYTLVKQSGSNFFEELAEKLRELWPPGEKDGKYPWRDSVSNLSRRLRALWAERFPTVKDGTYTIDECLTVARKYLAQFEDNAKYMMTLKYFIMKQDKIVNKNGHAIIINKSVFADMLESKSVVDDEWNSIFESTSTSEQGELI